MENRVIFQDRLADLKDEAEAYDGVLTQEQVKECLKGLPLEESHYQLIYEYLAEQNIRVVKSEKKAASKKEDSKENPEAPQERRSLSMYLDELSEFADVDDETETRLFVRARGGDEDAKGQLINLYLPVVCRIAEEYGEDVLPAEDLIQEGNIGLLNAMQGLEPYESTAACRAYLLNMIREAMDNAVSSKKEEREKDDTLVKRINHLNDAIHKLEGELGRKVSAEELSAYLEMPVEEIEDLLRVAGDQINKQ